MSAKSHAPLAGNEHHVFTVPLASHSTAVLTFSPFQEFSMKTRSLAVFPILALCASSVAAQESPFATFTPLPASSGPTADEASPILLSNPAFVQRSVADRSTQLAKGAPNSGNWDMITTNTHKGKERATLGRYLFTVFETGQGGVQRHDIITGRTDTIWMAPTPGSHVAFDASFWTPWGTFVTAEESWTTAAGGATSPYGRLFELRNPVTAPAILGEASDAANERADFVHQNVIPRVSHEGVQFDWRGAMYFIDELNGGCIYKYVTSAKMSQVYRGRADYFAKGTTYVLRVGDGTTPNATGSYTWVPITDKNGIALPGALTITDTNGVTSVDGRNTTDLPAFKGTDYQRPEDLQIQLLEGAQEYLYVATTTTNEVYRMDLQENTISVFANRNTIDLATGGPVGSGLASPDNLAVDHDGNMYIVEDRNGGVDNDIWLAVDRNKDGDLLDEGEGIGRWASNGTPGSEFTGLYFHPAETNRAWVNIQHPDSGVDRTIEIIVPHE
jgi:uncharacterized protein